MMMSPVDREKALFLPSPPQLFAGCPRRRRRARRRVREKAPQKGTIDMPFELSLPVLWLILLVIFGVVEGATAGLASIWFALGALAALITAMLDGPLWLQILLFLVVSFVTLLIIRPLARKYLTPRNEATNADRVIGAEGVVTLPIDNLKGEGQVNIAGQIWSARSSQPDGVIPAGQEVKVLQIQGVKVIVEPAQT